ncbi:jg16056 [Pararge aegeria aegeria]|uniref:Jg16056 protein n=1 Tax=Pararge aegeria aegeria TaxID=348720 RepID=A0A8S4SIP9_9NEOP|nr:jg16056 [Pararge aegeria aegeria]
MYRQKKLVFSKRQVKDISYGVSASIQAGSDISSIDQDGGSTEHKEKVSKYLDLAHEITAMWSVESTVVVPIVVLVNGLLAKSFDQHLKKLSLGCWIKGRIQKAVVLETARIVRRFLTLEP